VGDRLQTGAKKVGHGIADAQAVFEFISGKLKEFQGFNPSG
jgi:hypothetical protein